MIDRKEPKLPASALQLFFEDREQPRDWHDSLQMFDDLPVESRNLWQEKAAMDRKRFEQEKRDYNNTIQLDEDIHIDNEAIADCECGNGVEDILNSTRRKRCDSNGRDTDEIIISSINAIKLRNKPSALDDLTAFRIFRSRFETKYTHMSCMEALVGSDSGNSNMKVTTVTPRSYSHIPSHLILEYSSPTAR